MTTTQSLLSGGHSQQHTELTTTSATSVVDIPERGAHVTALHFSCDNASGTNVKVDHWDGSTVNPIWHQEAVSANDTLTLVFPSPFYLKTGQELRVTATDANRLHCWVFMVARQ